MYTIGSTKWMTLANSLLVYLINLWSTSITSAIAEAFSQMNGQSGDIVIPVYLGGTMLDEVIVNAQQRMNLRSGGR